LDFAEFDETVGVFTASDKFECRAFYLKMRLFAIFITEALNAADDARFLNAFRKTAE
jgi:hypothetical protein